VNFMAAIREVAKREPFHLANASLLKAVNLFGYDYKPAA